LPWWVSLSADSSLATQNLLSLPVERARSAAAASECEPAVRSSVMLDTQATLTSSCTIGLQKFPTRLRVAVILKQALEKRSRLREIAALRH